MESFELSKLVIQRIRLRMNDLNPKVDNVSDAVVYKPLKVYSVRYFDEILMVTSGPKIVGMELLNWVVNYLEGELELKVDRGRTVIHSATSQKIEYLGMEFQAVPPSILRPPISEKPKRARLKLCRQKEVRAMEMKNARERNRSKLGMKIFSHVFKKLKTSNNKFKIDYQIENEVNEIFRTWADEAVQEFLESLEEVNSIGAEVLEFIADYGKSTAPAPAAIVTCVPKKKKVHIEESGETDFKISPSEISEAIKSGLNQPIKSEPELEVPKDLITSL